MSGSAGSAGRNGRRSGWRALAIFWAGLAAVALLLAGVLQSLGPILPKVVALRPRATAVSAVAAPQPALLEPDPADPEHFLPRVASDGRAPRLAYAAPSAAPAAGTARIAIIMAGFGLIAPESAAALQVLPPAVSLAVSPYQPPSAALLVQARAAGHEYFLSLPMEPDSGPLNDAGNQAMLVSAGGGDNLDRLRWALSRVEGYVGVTDRLVGGLSGARFTGDAESVEPVLAEVARRGLDYAGAQPHPSGHPGLWTHPIDLAMRGDESASEIDARLAALAADARHGGSALAVVGIVRPVAVARIAAWARTLGRQGIALVPASALMAAPKER